MNTHFNHPNEITEQSFQAVKILRDLGIPIGNQTVLLKGVNDDTDVMRDLVHGLGRMGVQALLPVLRRPRRGNRPLPDRDVQGQGDLPRPLRRHDGLPPPDLRRRRAGRAGARCPVDLGYSDGISEDRKGGMFTSAIGLGKVYVNDPIERIEGKPSRHNPNRK